MLWGSDGSSWPFSSLGWSQWFSRLVRYPPQAEMLHSRQVAQMIYNYHVRHVYDLSKQVCEMKWLFLEAGGNFEIQKIEW
jgi:hypothetical protein